MSICKSAHAMLHRDCGTVEIAAASMGAGPTGLTPEQVQTSENNNDTTLEIPTPGA